MNLRRGGHKETVKDMEVAEMKMLRFAMEITRKDKIRNEYIRSTAKVERLGKKMKEGRLRCYGHVLRREQEYVGRKKIEIELPGKRKRGRPKRRFLDLVKEDMGEIGAKETDVEDRTVRRNIIRCGYPCMKGKAERRRRMKLNISFPVACNSKLLQSSKSCSIPLLKGYRTNTSKIANPASSVNLSSCNA